MPASRPASISPLSGRRILVVDDDADIRRMVAKVLETAGASVEHAATGAEAIRIVDRGEDLAAIVLDWNLFDMPADQLLTHLRSTRAELLERTAVMTGDLVRRGATHPAERHGLTLVHKPFRPRVLVDAVHRLIERATR